MITFTVPEINFICIFAGDTKAETISNIMDGIPHFSGNPEMVDIAEQSVIKLDGISESEFTEMNFKESFADEGA